VHCNNGRINQWLIGPMKDWHLLAKTLGLMNGGLVSGSVIQNGPVRINAFDGDKRHLVAENARSIASILWGYRWGYSWIFVDEYEGI
jgi:hypothetical protein